MSAQAGVYTRAAPPFGGYALVAGVAAFLAGVALRPVGPWASLTVFGWLLLALACALGGVAGGLVERRPALDGGSQPFARALLLAGALGCCLALGAARAAASATADAPDAIGRLATQQAVADAHGRTPTAYLRGEVVAEPDLRDTYRLLTVEVSAVSLNGRDWRPASGRIEAVVNGPDDWFAPAYGDTVSLSGALKPLKGGYAPDEAQARLTSARVKVLARGGGNPALAALFALRVRLAQAIQLALPEPEAALLIGILLGLKTPVLRARLPLFTATGTIHLVVPAGLKVATLAELASLAARRFGGWARTGAGLLAVTVYAALGGGGPAAVRAAIMGALLALAPALGRAYNLFTALALAALAMTLFDPALLYDAGFQLTVLATLGIPLLAPPMSRRLARWLGFLPASAAVAELLAVTLAAQLATLPVLALTFHQVSLVAPLANLLTVPLLAPLLALGALLAGASLLGGPIGGALTLALSWLLWPLLWFTDAAIQFCAALPAASLAVQNVPVALAWGYYALLVGALWGAPRWRRWRATKTARAAETGATSTPIAKGQAGQRGHVRLSRGALAVLLALALLGSLGASAPALAAPTAQLDFLNVGPGGAATLLRLPSGVTLLLNGGPSGSALEAALAGKLPFWQRSLDVALLSDARPGDARGLVDAASHFTIAHSGDAGMAHPSPDYLAWLDAMKRAGAVRTQMRQGEVIQLAPDTALRILAPPQTLYPPNQGDTNASDDLIVRLETPGLRALFLGAADDYALDALVYANEPLAADVVEVALPSRAPLDLDSSLGVLLDRAHPRLIVIDAAPLAPDSKRAQSAADVDYAAYDAEAAARLGALVYRVETAGTIELRGGAQGWALG